LWNDEGELDARLVVRVPDGVEAGLVGKVTGVSALTIEVQTRQGPDKVITDENTRFFVPGIENPSLADIAVDDIIVAGGVREEDCLHALVVAVTPERPQRAIRRGTVIAKDGSAFTLETPRGDQITILTDDQTRFRVAGVEEPDIDDVQVGFQTVAAGLLNPEDGTLLARIVGARPAPADLVPD
jgi:RNase P/RNase MRP subunit p29